MSLKLGIAYQKKNDYVTSLFIDNSHPLIPKEATRFFFFLFYIKGSLSLAKTLRDIRITLENICLDNLTRTKIIFVMAHVRLLLMVK